MFDKRWHLRRERFVIYQLAMLIGLSAECTATYSLAKYENLQSNIEDNFAGSHLYQNDICDAAIATIVFCVFVATIFGADFFFLLQYPRRMYPRWYQRTKIAAGFLISLAVLGTAIASTIIVARHSAVLGGAISPETAADAVALYYRPPLRYSIWAVNVAWVVQLWVANIFCFWSAYLMLIAARWDELNGTEPRELTAADAEKMSPQPSIATVSRQPEE